MDDAPNTPADSTARAPEGVPWAPGRLPGIGHARQLIRDPLPFVRSLPRFGPVVKVGMGPRPLYMATTIELVRDVGLGRAGQFHRDNLIEPVAPFTGRSLVTLSGDPHRRRRRLIAPAFHRNRIAVYAESYAEIADRWLDSLPVGTPFEATPFVEELAIDTLMGSLITSDVGADARALLSAKSPELLAEASIRTIFPVAVAELRRGAHRRFLETSARMRAEATTVVEHYREHGEDRGDLLSTLVTHVDPATGDYLSDEDIVDEIVGFVMGGIESPAGMLLATLHELTHSPTSLSEVIDEIDDVIGSGPVRARHATELPVTRRALLETMRLWTSWITLLDARGDIRLGDLVLPDGSQIGMSPQAIHHDPRNFPRPDSFEPHRWLPGHESEARDTAAIPFGVGVRNCPADLYSWSALTIQIAAILQRFLPVAADAGAPRTAVGYTTKGVGIRPNNVRLTLFPRGALPAR